MNGPWMLTASGQEYILAGPRVLFDNRPLVEDIAHHLSQINRYTGATSRPYSVAEHSLLVERIGQRRGASAILRMALLMHDGHEAYTTDMSSPAKAAIGQAWHEFEMTHALNLRQHLGLRTVFASKSREIRTCDLIALATERRDLTRFDAAAHRAWPPIDTTGSLVEPADERLDPDEPPMDWRSLRGAFMDKYRELHQLVAQQQAALETAA